jgi:hypothetical protein
LFVKAVARIRLQMKILIQELTYARTKAATPAMAATKTEPERLAADPVKVAEVGVEVAAGAVTFLAYEIVPVDDGTALEETGVTVMVE